MGRYKNPYYWVDDYSLLYGNNGSLEPGTYVNVGQNLGGICPLIIMLRDFFQVKPPCTCSPHWFSHGFSVIGSCCFLVQPWTMPLGNPCNPILLRRSERIDG